MAPGQSNPIFSRYILRESAVDDAEGGKPRGGEKG